MKRIFCAVDVSNLYYCCMSRYHGKLNYEKLMDYIKGFGEVVQAVCYGAQKEREADSFIYKLKQLGFVAKYKRPKEYHSEGNVRHKADWDVGITLDVVNAILYQHIDMIVLVTADGDLSLLVEWVRNRGLTAVVIGTNISNDLKTSATEFIEIPESLVDIERNSNETQAN